MIAKLALRTAQRFRFFAKKECQLARRTPDIWIDETRIPVTWDEPMPGVGRPLGASDAVRARDQSRRGGSRTRYEPHSRWHRAAIDRLNQHRPDLAARIRAKKMSANAAAIPSGPRGRLAVANCTSSRAVHSIGAAQALLTVGP
jgi:hypothetical protein